MEVTSISVATGDDRPRKQRRHTTKASRSFIVLCLVVTFSFTTLSFRVHAFQDPLATPAKMVGDLEHRPTQAVATAGERLIAVGLRGLIIYSDDGGDTWTQSSSPVQSDLLAIHFPSETTGWIVGHDGVVLHSKDAGVTWSKQFDARMALTVFTDYYEKQLSSGNEEAERALQLIELNYGSGPALPFLDVWFENDLRGFAVGAFGLLALTTDGGVTWEPWLNRIDNEEQLHLNAIEGINGDIYIAAERGVLFRLDRERRRFVAQQTGQERSLFGVVGADDGIITYGLGGAVYKSSDSGISWKPLATPSNTLITSGTALPGTDQFILANTVGELLRGNGTSDSLTLANMNEASRVTGLVLLPSGALLISSLQGVSTIPLSDQELQP